MVAITKRSLLVALVSMGLVLALLGALLAIGTIWPAQAQPGRAPNAATLTVTTTADNINCGTLCSLRGAIVVASPGDTIDILAGVYTLTSGVELAIGKDLTLRGAGAKTTIIQAAAVNPVLAPNDPGVATSRVFNITGGNVTISGVTIRHGKSSGSNVAGNGGGILNSGTLTLTNDTIEGNTGVNGGGGVENLSSGTITLSDSTVSNNSSILNLGGGIKNDGVLNVKNSTISGNTGISRGGGIFNHVSGAVTITNGTVSNNSNGGIFHESTFKITNTIIAKNSGSDCGGIPITSLGHNLDSDGTCSLSVASGDLPNTDPKLGPLQDNGGPTETHALLPWSPAVDAIPVADCVDKVGNPITGDQRGVARPQGPACDIGAYELEPSDYFVYSSKIVCVPHLGPASPALMPGKYRTAVNVHNPWDQSANIEKWLTLSPPQGKSQITGDRISETLAPWAAFDIDCPHLRDDFGLPDGAKVPGGKGFLVIRSDRELDVVAVYTTRTQTKAGDGVGASVDVETIEPKIRGVVP